MYKISKFLKLSLFGMATFLLMIIGTSATVQTLNHAVKTMQGYTTLPSVQKSKSSYMAGVVLSLKDPEAVTFSVRAKETNGEWTSYYNGTTVTTLNTNYVVYYQANYGVGTEVNARFRNSNFTLNSGQIEGEFNYN